ncbi:MAG: hypothetical protein AAB881_01380 [Patescibacteria group bacterium]
MPYSPEAPQYSPDDDLKDELIGHNPHRLRGPLFDKKDPDNDPKHQSEPGEREPLEDSL